MKRNKPCPCGAIPKTLFITTTSQGRKWTAVSGSCCDTWLIEFPTEGLTDFEVDEAGAVAWNAASRSWNIKEE